MNEIQVAAQPLRETIRPEESAAVMKDALRLLDPVGGFDLVSTTVDKAENLDPGEPVMKEIFLTEAESRAERRELKNRLRAWIDLLSGATNPGEMVEKSEAQAQATQHLLHANVKTALDASRKLEENYRSVAMFYKNAAGDKPVRNVSLVNAPLEQIKDLDNPVFFNAIADELRDKYDRLDLMNNYSLMVLPGYLGAKAVIDKWARLAHENKVMLVTDFRNLNSPEQVIKLFEAGKFTGAEDFRANVMMTCNWLVGRERAAEAGEEAPLYIPPSTALAGRMYANNLAQVTAGKKYGALYEVQGVKFDVRANVLEEMVSMGLVPMVYEFGQVQAFSPKTLFNGTNLGLQTYSVVRTFDWLTKSIMDYLNRMLFQNISKNMEMDIRKEISRFLDQCKREKRVIETFGKVDVQRDPNQLDRVVLNVHITPYFPAKSFIIKLDGKGGQSPDWDAQYAE